MAAIISSTGTFSGLQNTNPTSPAPGAVVNEAIRDQFQGVEQRAASLGQGYRPNYEADRDGQQEIMQFAGIMAAAYAIPVRAALVRIRDIISAQLGTEDVEYRRVYIP